MPLCGGRADERRKPVYWSQCFSAFAAALTRAYSRPVRLALFFLGGSALVMLCRARRFGMSGGCRGITWFGVRLLDSGFELGCLLMSCRRDVFRSCGVAAVLIQLSPEARVSNRHDASAWSSRMPHCRLDRRVRLRRPPLP